MKYLQRLKIGFGVLLVAALVTGCASTMEDLTNTPPYSKYINHQYSINEDCYVFYFNEEPDVLCIGLAPRCRPLPREVDSKYINHSQNGVKIVGIIPKDSVFQIVALYRENTIENSYYHYKVKPVGDLFEKWPLLDASFITKEIVTPPIILPAYATPTN
jgi:hypothetical protein